VVTITEPGGSIGGVQLPRWSSFLAINWDNCMSAKTNKNHNRWRFFSPPGWVPNDAACPCGQEAPWVSRQAHGSIARAAWSWATRGGEASTTCLKLKKTARPPDPTPAAADVALSSLEKDLEFISSPIWFRIFGVIYIFIGYQ
jgi:hypothetical protein